MEDQADLTRTTCLVALSGSEGRAGRRRKKGWQIAIELVAAGAVTAEPIHDAVGDEVGECVGIEWRASHGGLVRARRLLSSASPASGFGVQNIQAEHPGNQELRLSCTSH